MWQLSRQARILNQLLVKFQTELDDKINTFRLNYIHEYSKNILLIKTLTERERKEVAKITEFYLQPNFLAG